MTQVNFNKKVYDVVRVIPKGNVATYGQIAALLGSPRAARVVGWAMHAMDSLPSDLFKLYPWWRVINSKGFISTTCEEHTYELQKKLLEKDKIKVNWVEDKKMYCVDLDKYLWLP